jgi:alpha/beta superfamily hydrolase
MSSPPAFPEQSAALFLPGPVGRIEVAVELPPAHERRAGVAVIAHPHPPDGGTMHNKVVTMCARALGELGLATVRFNFRGIGQSEGAYDEGRGEVLDFLAVAEWARKQLPADALWLAGFSFGAWVALQAARQLPAKQMVSIAPPVGLRDFSGVLAPTCPWLVIQGELDELVPAQGVYDWLALQSPPPTLVKMPETGHFFHRRLMDLRGAIKNGVQRPLPPPR